MKLNRVLDWIPQVSDDNGVAGDVVVLVLLLLMFFLVIALLVFFVLTKMLEPLLILVNIVTFPSPQPWNPATTNPSQKLKDGRNAVMTVELLILRLQKNALFLQDYLQDVMSTTVDTDMLTDIVVVTCYGAFRDDVRLLKGGKICSLCIESAL